MSAGGLVKTIGRLAGAAILAASLSSTGAHAASGTIVALGASNTYGKGVARNQSYPAAQLEAILRAKGHTVRVVNAGINGNTTGQMLARVDRAVPKGTGVVILQPGGNDRRRGEGDTSQNVAEFKAG